MLNWTLLKEREFYLLQPLVLVAILLALVLFGWWVPQTHFVRWEVVEVLGAMLLLRAAMLQFARRDIRLDLLDGILVLFGLYAALSLLWSDDPLTGALFMARFTVLGALYFYLKHQPDSRLSVAVTAMVAVAMGVVLAWNFQKEIPFGGYFQENFVTEFVFLAACLTGLLLVIGPWITRFAAAALIVTAAYYLLWENASRLEYSAALAVGYFLLQCALIARSPRRALFIVLQIVLLLVPIAVIAAAWVLSPPLQAAAEGEGFTVSLTVRAMIFLNTLAAWADQPLLGHGIGSFDAVYPLYAERYQGWFTIPQGYDQLRVLNIKAGAAHNDFLQILLELGWIGLMLVASYVAMLFYGFARCVLRCGGDMRVASGVSRRVAFLGMTVSVAAMAEAMIEFPFQNAPTALIAVIGLGMVAREAGAVLPRIKLVAPLWLNYMGAGLLLFAAVGLVLLAERQERANQLFGRFLTLRGNDPNGAFHALYEAYDADPLAYRYRMQLYPYLIYALGTATEERFPTAENDRIFAISSKRAQYSPIVLVARLQYLLNTGRIVERAEEARQHFDRLMKTSKRVTEVWIMKAYFHAVTGDIPQAKEAIAKARTMDPTLQQMITLGQMEAMLGIEPAFEEEPTGGGADR